MTVTSFKPKLDRVKVTRTSNLSVPASTEVFIPWQATEYDFALTNASGMWVSGNDINIYRDGYYMVVVNVDWSATSAGHYRQSRLYGNGSGTLSTEVVVSGITSDFRTIFQNQWMGALGPSFTNDSLSFSVLSNAGVATTLGSAATWAAVTLVRPL